MSADNPTTRSVRISDDERGGWSSDRPRRDGSGRPPRPVDVSTRCRVLRPTDRMRYTPGSLVVVVSADADERDRFTGRVFEEKGAVFSLEKVRTLLAGRVEAGEADERAGQLLEAAVRKRLEAGESVVLAASGLDPAERERFVRMAHALRRPRHLILVEVPRDRVADEDRVALNELRKALDDGSVGQEGFQTALRLGGGSVGELKRVVFRPPPQDD
jgi:predicted kinase